MIPFELTRQPPATPKVKGAIEIEDDQPISFSSPIKSNKRHIGAKQAKRSLFQGNAEKHGEIRRMADAAEK